MRRFFTDEIENMRDLGGYLTRDGRVIKMNCLIRSNLPKYLSLNCIDELVSNGITTVIDLRNDEEIAKEGGVFRDNELFRYYHVKIKGDGRLPESPEKVYDSYIEMIEGKEEIGKVFSIIANTNGGVIYYCNAGKDRTGVVSALILKLLGVKDKDIVEDYVVSGVYLKNMLEDFANKVQKEKIREIITPKKETMVRVLEYIENKYGTIENYLKSCGVTEEELVNFKAKFLEVYSYSEGRGLYDEK